MKLNKIMIAAITFGMVSIANAAPTDQGHGTVKFEGSIIDAPCSITPDTVDQTVNLGQISNVILKDGGKSSPKNFYIKLENCDTSLKKSVTVAFSGANSAGNPDLLGITGTAKGASIAITDGSGSVIKLGQSSNPQGILDINNTLAFSAYLQGDMADATTGAVIVPGEFSSIANFTMSYQ
ncbi:MULTISPECIES: fimbrial protein [Proteus]|uniref:fimbrial protein n=1 Tax=Proteus TaxID=583 RepID=UPI000197D039|nr:MULTISPECIES: fimbrial protein [Proteus]EEG83329.1 fimbria A protein [Proteus penneri ATCC 35198]NBM13192.1 fimbrial protein [Proteus sp. G2670]NBM34351.1 fimbrial protein [Proteus sp. G2664]NBM87957.1 fimbrial protein [Proteus sp. G2661]NBN03807.1 fimbrial protein [Proteus sp. G2665]